MENASVCTFAIPPLFQAKENKIKRQMKLLVEDKKVATIKGRKTKGEPRFQLLDLDHNPIATACKKPFHFGSQVEVYDMWGGLMGSVEHFVENPMTKPIEKYVVFDGYGRPVAAAKQQNQIGTSLVLLSNEGERVFSMRKGLKKLRDSWEIESTEHIDKRVAIIMPIFVSSELGRQLA